MSDAREADIEHAARAEAERRWPRTEVPSDMNYFATLGFERGASWLAEYLLSNENVEKAARVIFEDDHLTQIGWDEVDQRGWLDCARAALSAVLGKES